MKNKIKLHPYQLFDFKEKKYIFTSKKNRLFKIDDNMYKELINPTNDYEIEVSKQSSYLSVFKQNLCVEDDISNERDNFDLQSIVLMIIQDCNLNCKYCYGDGGEFKERGMMSLETAKKAIDYLLSHCGKRRSVGVVFFGGEPLLNMDLLKNVIVYLEEVSKKTKININKSITTNATLLTSEIRDYLIEKGVSIKISIDGPKSIHDNMRVFLDGKGSFDEVIKNTKELREMGKAVARATVTPFCLETKEIETFLYESGFSDVGMAYAVESLKADDYKKIYEIESSYFDEIKKFIQAGRYDEIRKKYTKVITYLAHLHSNVIGNYPCGAGRTFYAVDKDGFLYPCQRFVGTPEFQLGNIYSEKNKQNEFLKKMHIKAHTKCNQCWCKNICMGKCSYDNYIKTNKIEEPYTLACELTKKLYECAVELYVLLSDDEKKQLFYDKRNNCLS